MKTTITTLLTAICVSGLLLTAAAQPDNGGPPDNNAAATTDQSTQPAAGADAGATPPDAAQAPPAPMMWIVPDGSLGMCVSLFGCPKIPLDRFSLVLFNALTILIF